MPVIQHIHRNWTHEGLAMDKQKNADFLKKAGSLFTDFNNAISANERLNKIVTAALVAPVLAVSLMASSGAAEAATPSANAGAAQVQTQASSMFGKLKAGVLSSKAAVESAGRSALASADAGVSSVVTATEKLKTGVESSSVVQKIGSTTEKLKTGVKSNSVVQKFDSTTEKLKTGIETNSVVQKIDSTTEKLRAGIESNSVMQKIGTTTDKLKTGIESNAVVQKVGSSAEKLKVGSAAAVDTGAALVAGATNSVAVLGKWVSGQTQKIGQRGVPTEAEAAPAEPSDVSQKLGNAKAALGSFFKSDGYARAGNAANQNASAEQVAKVSPSSGPRL